METKTKTPSEILETRLYFNIDMLECKLAGTYQEHFQNDDLWRTLQILHDNNATSKNLTLMGENFTYRKWAWKGSWYSDTTIFDIVVNGITTPAFAINKWSKKIKNETTKHWEILDISKLVIYGSLFTAEHNGFLSFKITDFHKKYFPTSTDIARLDLCADFEATKPEILTIFDKVIPKFTSQMGTDPKYPECSLTYYQWDTSRSKNPYKVLRIYDKKVESFESWKTYLYPYVSYCDDVQRVEIEMRSVLLSQLNLKFPELYEDKTRLENLFSTEIEPYSSFFEHFDFTRTYKKYQKTQISYLKSIPNRYKTHQCFPIVSKVFREWGFNGLCEMLLQPVPSTPKFKLKNWEFQEIWREEHIGKWDDRRKYKNETFETVINPLSFLDVYIKYLQNTVHIPKSKINKILRERYIQDTRIKELTFEQKVKKQDKEFPSFGGGSGDSSPSLQPS